MALTCDQMACLAELKAVALGRCLTRPQGEGRLGGQLLPCHHVGRRRGLSSYRHCFLTALLAARGKSFAFVRLVYGEGSHSLPVGVQVQGLSSALALYEYQGATRGLTVPCCDHLINPGFFLLTERRQWDCKATLPQVSDPAPPNLPVCTPTHTHYREASLPLPAGVGKAPGSCVNRSVTEQDFHAAQT